MNPQDWIGNTQISQDVLMPSVLRRFDATLWRDQRDWNKGDAAPHLAHWLCFLPEDPMDQVGPDGHPKRGGFLPPIHDLPRRMWAGSRIEFLNDLPVGVDIEKRSEILSVTEKQGRQGALVFVTVRHEISHEGAVLIRDEHDIVYRDAPPPGAAPVEPKEVEPGEMVWELEPDPVLLFRYSALTFNSHRIHYDLPYVHDEENYPQLIVHGPLIATLILENLSRQAPDLNVKQFNFRAVAPTFVGDKLQLNANAPNGDGEMKLWASKNDNRLGMDATAIVA
ncbi:MAG: MaoC family dehydratase N-terminal domain-containing protein [Pseudomonadota bacterium]